jgi:hypothetical protein
MLSVCIYLFLNLLYLYILGKNLHDSLDANRSKTLAVQVSVERAEDNHISLSLVISGAALAIFGFGIYYIFPLALLAMNFALLLSIPWFCKRLYTFDRVATCSFFF